MGSTSALCFVREISETAPHGESCPCPLSYFHKATTTFIMCMQVMLNVPAIKYANIDRFRKYETNLKRIDYSRSIDFIFTLFSHGRGVVVKFHCSKMTP